MWFFNKTCTSKTCLDGKTVVITGASDGIGKETARDLYARGARVILACRNMEKANKAVEDIKSNPPSRFNKSEYKNNAGELAIYFLDLRSLKSVRDCAKNLLTNEAAIHILVNNAGVAAHPNEKTEDGNQTTLQVNHLGHFLMTLLLLPKMQKSSPNCRIVNVSSLTHFCINCGVTTPYRKANQHEYPEKLWNASCRLLHLEPEEDFTTFLETVSRQML
ncbi:RDH11 dehydrogenase, partial [Pseudoatta argentina]